MNKDKITRVEVITDKGREFVKWDCKIKLEIQDDGKTLKVFTSENEKDLKTEFEELKKEKKELTKLPFYFRKEENTLNYEGIVYAQAEAWLNQELEFCSYIPEKVINVNHSNIPELKVEDIPKDAVAYLEVIPNKHLEKIYSLKKVNLLEENQPVH